MYIHTNTVELLLPSLSISLFSNVLYASFRQKSRYPSASPTSLFFPLYLSSTLHPSLPLAFSLSLITEAEDREFRSIRRIVIRVIVGLGKGVRSTFLLINKRKPPTFGEPLRGDGKRRGGRAAVAENAGRKTRREVEGTKGKRVFLEMEGGMGKRGGGRTEGVYRVRG